MVIGLPGCVRVAHPADRLLPGVAIGVHGVLEFVGWVRVEEHVDHLGQVPEDIIRSPPHNDAGSLGSQVADHLGLGQDGPVMGGKPSAGQNQLIRFPRPSLSSVR